MTTSNRLKRNLHRLGTAGVALGVAVCASGATRLENPEVNQPLGSLVPFVLSDTNLAAGNVKGYRPWFENGSWQGDIGEYDVSKKTGELSSTISYAGTTPSNSDPDNGNWSALVTFKAMVDADEDYWESRKIITMVNGNQEPFTWTDIGAANRALIDENAENDNAPESLILNHIRGDHSQEFPDGDLRDRVSVLGDIVHNKPVYVGAPDANQVANGYAAWATELKDREHRLYVGANDGMLHAFDVSDGSEVWAYIPSMLMGNLRAIADLPFNHHYFVDGHLTAADAYFDGAGATGANAEWHTVLIGTLGAGGRGIFALDITDPDLDNASSPGEGDTKAMWERSAVGDDDLGYTFTKGVVAKLNDGNWYVVIGNGYSSVNGKAVLYIINIATGAVVRKISTTTGTAASPNGLSSPALLDEDRDGMVDVAYAGDIDGDLWEFDLSSSDKSDWRVAYNGRPLYNGDSTQPITVQPRIALHPNNGYLVYFGTGKLLSPEDKLDTSVQGLFAIHDDGNAPPASPTLHSQPHQMKEYVSGAISEEIAIYNPDSGDVNWTDDDVLGWKVLFPAGYRMLRPIQLRSNRVKGTIVDPTAENSPNWLLEAAIWDGGPHVKAIYDLNRDGELLDDDLFQSGGENSTTGVPMMWRQADGIMSEVTIARIGNGVDTLFLNYLVPPLDDEEPCTEDCSGGFKGGHIDVDTWHMDAPYAGVSTEHDHEFDKQIGQVYVDFFNLNVPADGEEPPRKDITGQVNVDDDGTDPAEERSGIDPEQKFVVLVANADFSPGSTMTLGTRDWHVWEYQVAIHMALKNWNPNVAGSVPTYDRDDLEEDGNDDWEPIPLAFSWGEIAADGGTIQHSFNDRSIIDGGLHPTQTGCVKDSAYGAAGGDPTTLVEFGGELVGRWRNGALTTQIVALEQFTTNPAIDSVRITYPLDLKLSVPVDGFGDISSRLDFDGNGSFEHTNHEFIGGLVAAGGDELLWESTLFWHFGDLAQLVLKARPCYGDAEWRDAVKLEQSNNPVAAALDIADDNTDFDFSNGDIDDAIAAVRQCVLDEGDGGGNNQDLTECQQLLKMLNRLQEVLEDYEVIDNTNPDDPGEPGEAQPEVIEGSVTQQSDTQGMTFDYGRMSWTDVP